jgi:2-polyprenyl-3-methyl-5-hydroxy-6-metoxy-1,4-benzoquinol methylase
MTAEEIERGRDDVIRQAGPWTAENIHLGDGVYTMGPDLVGVAEHRVKRIVQIVSDWGGRDLDGMRVLDLGCYEGGFAIELARRGAVVTALEAREIHVRKATFARDVLGLDKLTIHHGDVRELASIVEGTFDTVLCLGILYHLQPVEALELLAVLAERCDGLLVLETQIGFARASSVSHRGHTYRGREYKEDTGRGGASVVNNTSFMPTRASLLNALNDVGMSSVCEVMNPVIPTLAAYRDHVTLIARSNNRIDYMDLPSDRWPERLAHLAHPAQGLRYDLLERWRRRRGGGLKEIFVKHPRN